MNGMVEPPRLNDKVPKEVFAIYWVIHGCENYIFLASILLDSPMVSCLSLLCLTDLFIEITWTLVKKLIGSHSCMLIIELMYYLPYSNIQQYHNLQY